MRSGSNSDLEYSTKQSSKLKFHIMKTWIHFVSCCINFVFFGRDLVYKGFTDLENQAQFHGLIFLSVIKLCSFIVKKTF